MDFPTPVPASSAAGTPSRNARVTASDICTCSSRGSYPAYIFPTVPCAVKAWRTCSSSGYTRPQLSSTSRASARTCTVVREQRSWRASLSEKGASGSMAAICANIGR